MDLINVNSRESFSKIETKYEFDEFNNWFDKLEKLINTFVATGSDIDFIRAVELGDIYEPHLDETYDFNEFQKLVERFKGRMINNFQIRSYYNSNQIHIFVRPHSRSVTIRHSPEIQSYIASAMIAYVDLFRKK